LRAAQHWVRQQIRPLEWADLTRCHGIFTLVWVAPAGASRPLLREFELMDAKDFVRSTVTDHPVVLFMKGTAQFPQCGFSGRAMQILKSCAVSNLVTVNVLEDDEVRQAVKDFANWPTVPQLYVRGQFVGGSDIMAEMYESGELQALLQQAPAS